MAAQRSYPIGARTLPYLTAGGLMMLALRMRHRRRAAGIALANAGAVLAASLFTRYRRGSSARQAESADTPYGRGRTIYRNTPTTEGDL